MERELAKEMNDFDHVDYEAEFKKLDEGEFVFFAKALAGYRRALIAEDFTETQAMRLVATYAKFIYDMSIEDFIAQQREKEFQENFPEDDSDVDTDDEEEL